MSMPISDRAVALVLLCLALTACDERAGAPKGPFASHSGEGGGVADCAVGGSVDWARNCPVEQDGDILTLRHADGGFRRFRIVKDGRGLETADGAERSSVAVIGKGQIELSVGQDRYRMPATIAATAR